LQLHIVIFVTKRWETELRKVDK